MTYDELCEQGLDPARIPDHMWKDVSLSEDGLLTQECVLQEELEGVPGVTLRRQVNIHEEALLAKNRESYDTDQKWSRKNSELDAKVAEIPLNVFYRDQRIQDGLKGDRDAMKHFLNDDENRKYRTIKGKI